MSSFEEVIRKLDQFWSSKGCAIVAPYDMEVGAGTFHPFSILRVLDKNDFSFACNQPCRRPGDSFAVHSPHRRYKFHQYQVILKKSPIECLDYFYESLNYIGIDTNKNEIRLIENDWQSATLKAYGVGWEAQVNGMEICQVTHFKQVGGITCPMPTTEFAYGLERLVLKTTNQHHFYDCQWNDKYTYGDLFKWQEEQFSMTGDFAIYDIDDFFLYLKKSTNVLKHGSILIAYEMAVRACDIFNYLDAKNLIGQLQKIEFVHMLQDVFHACCKAWQEKY